MTAMMNNESNNGTPSNGIQRHDYKSYLENGDFQDFMKAAAQEFIKESSIEELAEIVYGDIDEAIEAFDKEYYADDPGGSFGYDDDDDNNDDE
jgi:hypothetical protein